MSESFEIHDLDRFTVGTQGEPGNRLFVFQAQAGAQIVTLKVEKQQVATLSTYLGDLIKELPRPGHLPEGAELDLTEPFQIDWVAGSISASYEEAIDRLIIFIEEAVVIDDEDLIDADPEELASRIATARFSLTREQAGALAIKGRSLVEAGRPPCPLCGHPIDPAGHACPRTNGNRPPQS